MQRDDINELSSSSSSSEDEEGVEPELSIADEKEILLKNKKSFTNYYSNDNINNLRLKITVRTGVPDVLEDIPVTEKGLNVLLRTQEDIDFAKSFKDDDDDNEYNDNRLRNDKHHNDKYKEEIHIIQWQEKKFNVREVLTYVRDRQRPKTVISDRYNEMIKEKVLNIKPSAIDHTQEKQEIAIHKAEDWVKDIEDFHIGTYINNDNYINPADYLLNPTTSTITTTANKFIKKKTKKIMKVCL